MTDVINLVKLVYNECCFIIIIFILRDLDPAMVRRLEKRILVDIPNETARKVMFETHLPKVVIPNPPMLTEDMDYDLLAQVTFI